MQAWQIVMMVLSKALLHVEVKSSLSGWHLLVVPLL
jgi:hypothetical protein